jgi:hypothetical protein
MSAPAPANAPASTGFLSSLFGAKKENKPANAAAPAAPATGGRRRSKSRKSRSRKHRSRKDRSRSRKDRSRKNRN